MDKEIYESIIAETRLILSGHPDIKCKYNDLDQIVELSIYEKYISNKISELQYLENLFIYSPIDHLPKFSPTELKHLDITLANAKKQLKLPQCPKLKKLNIAAYGILAFPQLPDLDNLQDLRINCDFDFSLSYLPALPHLQKLKITAYSCNSFHLLPQFQTITHLSLYFHSFSKIPKEIFQLPNLKELTIEINQLNSLSTEEIKLLKAIPQLTFIIRGYSHVNPNDIPYLKDYYFNFKYKGKRTPAAEFKFDLEVLTHQYLKQPQNQYSSSDEGIKFGPTFISNSEFILEFQKVTVPPLPDSIFAVKELNSIRFSNNNLSKIPPKVFKLKNLISLEIDNNNLTEIPEEITNLQNLRYLNLFNNKIETIPEFITKLPKLEILGLQNNNITYLPQFLLKCPSLKELHLSGNTISEFPYFLLETNKLDHLSIKWSNLTKKQEEVVEKFKKGFSSFYYMRY